MYITANNNQYSPYAFKSTRQRVTDSMGRVINCHYTNLNRADVDWMKFAQMLAERFRNQEKVKINLFGCSDGSDAYTLAVNLRNCLGKFASKFFPIEASDISPELIGKARDGIILLHDKDLQYLKDTSSLHLFKRDYSEQPQIMRDIVFYPYNVQDELRKDINFSVKDVRSEAKKHDFSNEVFIFRNGWTFMDLDTQNQIIKDLACNSNKSTLCLIGQSDLFKSNACEFFQRNGFQGIDSDVFTKAETDYPSATIGIPKEKSKYPEFILFNKCA